MTPKLANLRPHQERGLSLLRQSLLAGHRRPMVQAPTGAGKTILGAAMTLMVPAAKAKRCWLLCRRFRLSTKLSTLFGKKA
jgi:superfamily II DNA or RNA helicase